MVSYFEAYFAPLYNVTVHHIQRSYDMYLVYCATVCPTLPFNDYQHMMQYAITAVSVIPWVLYRNLKLLFFLNYLIIFFFFEASKYLYFLTKLWLFKVRTIIMSCKIHNKTTPQLWMYPIFLNFQLMLMLNGHNFINNENYLILQRRKCKKSRGAPS